MKRLTLIFGILVLAACGADGEPETPQPAVGVSVTVEYGVSGSF